MSDAPESALTPEDRETIRGILEARASTARLFTLVAAIPLALFALRMWAASLRRAGIGGTIAAAMVGAVAVVGFLVWYFGWRPVRLVRLDLQGGVKQRMSGTIQGIERAGNSYGETITHVTIESVKLSTRAAMFAESRQGDSIEVDFLPRSKVALGVHRQGA